MQREDGHSRKPSAGSRLSAKHAHSSAFSVNANPDEDWTKISDLAERRRIQNRIAQRNYREKLKRRLEDLEKRATSTSTSPEQSHRQLGTPQQRASQSGGAAARTKTRKSASGSSARSKCSSSTSLSTCESDSSFSSISSHYRTPNGECSPMFLQENARNSKQLSATASPSPAFFFPPYSSSYDSYGQQHQQQQQHHHQQGIYGLPPPVYHSNIPGIYGDMPMHGEYLEPLPSTLPCPGSGRHRSSSTTADEGLINQYNTNYPMMASIELCASPRPQSESNMPTVSYSSQNYSREDLESPSLSPDVAFLAMPLTPPEAIDAWSPLSFPFL